jgi:hypothetical protein
MAKFPLRYPYHSYWNCLSLSVIFSWKMSPKALCIVTDSMVIFQTLLGGQEFPAFLNLKDHHRVRCSPSLGLHSTFLKYLMLLSDVRFNFSSGVFPEFTTNKISSVIWGLHIGAVSYCCFRCLWCPGRWISAFLSNILRTSLESKGRWWQYIVPKRRSSPPDYTVS